MKKLNFGCGKNIKKGYTNVDIVNYRGVDQTFDFNFFPYPFNKNTFDEIYADNILEHLDNLVLVMNELHRITKPEGIIKIIVPHYNCYGSYNDVTHKHYFSHLTFEPFYKKDARCNYFSAKKFKLKELKLIPTRFGRFFLFDSIRLPLSYVIGQIIQNVDITLIVKKNY